MTDVDPEETAEWLEALDAVLERDGPPRAQDLLARLTERARNGGATPPYDGHDAVRQHDPARRRGSLSGRPATSSTASAR